MPEANSHRLYWRTEFVALASGPVPEPLLRAKLAELTLTAPIVRAEVLPTGDVAISFAGYPTEDDADELDQFVAEFEGGETTAKVAAVVSTGVTSASNATPVVAADGESAPLDEGQYLAVYTSTMRLSAAADATAARAIVTLTRSDGSVFTQDDHWPHEVDHAFNGSIPFDVVAGQTIHGTMAVAKVGAGAANALMADVRISLIKTE